YAYQYNSGKIFMGGGGGSGDYNNILSPPGGNGGGIIVIRANTVNGNGGAIVSNGDSVPIYPNNIGDGAAGGGAGGTILLDVAAFSGTLSVIANGGKG